MKASMEIDNHSIYQCFLSSSSHSNAESLIFRKLFDVLFTPFSQLFGYQEYIMCKKHCIKLKYENNITLSLLVYSEMSSISQYLLQMCSSKNFLIPNEEVLPAQKYNSPLSSQRVSVAISGS